MAGRLLDRFEEVGLVDDEAFARSWVDSRQRTRGLARRALAQELRRKGVADETAREVLAEVDPGDEEQLGARSWCARSCAACAASTTPSPPVGSPACSPGRAFPAGLAYAVVKDELAAAGREAPAE